MFKKIITIVFIASLIGCSAMPREKLKTSFADVDIGDDILALLEKLKQDNYNCHTVTQRVDKNRYPSVPADADYYSCSAETDRLFCLHTGKVIFASQNDKLVFIEQGVYRSKVCLWTH